MYHTVCSDLDNTLLMPDKSLSEKTKRVLQRLIDEGIMIIPSTGRAFWSIPKEIREFPGFEYAIVSNGAAIYDIKSEKPVISLTLEEDFAGQLFDFLKQREEYVTYECFVEGQAYTSDDYFRNPADFGIKGDYERNYVQSTRIAVPDIEAFILEHAGELDALDVILLPEDRDRVCRDIQEAFDGIYITTSVPHLIEISNEKSGKHNGMKVLMEHLGKSVDGVVAFGDGDNDHEMLAHAGLGVAVSNASKICKQAADKVIGESKEEAVAIFLEELFYGKN